MFGRQYPIWNQVTACIYKSNKSYGVQNTGEVTIKVGTSNSNSHTFLRHCTTHRVLENGDREYRFYIDDVCVRKAVLPKGKYTLEHKKIVPIKWENQNGN